MTSLPMNLVLDDLISFSDADISTHQSEEPEQQSDSSDDVLEHSHVRLFNEGEGAQVEEILIQDRLPKKNDLVAFYDNQTGVWVTDLRLTSDAVKPWKYWYHYVDKEGREGGVELKPNERWTFLVEEDNSSYDAEHGSSSDNDPHAVHQTDGVVDPDSLTPSSATSTGATAKSVRLTPGVQYSDSESDGEPLNTAVNLSPHASLDWDAFGTDLESPPRFFNQPALQIDLTAVQNLDRILPLTSTPREDASMWSPWPPSVVVTTPTPYLPTPTEPAEHDGASSTVPEFLTRLNPFKKKHK